MRPPSATGLPERAMADLAGSEFRCGFVAIVGRPNVGKSTLLNRLVGQKISITSKKAQTTRHRVTGIVTGPGAQIVFVDTPGFQTLHRSRLNERMNRVVRASLLDVDAIVLVVEAGRTTAADRAVIDLLPQHARAVVAQNKIDLQKDKDVLLPQMAVLAALYPFAALVPIAAEKEQGLDRLITEITSLLPVREPLFGSEEITDRDERFFASELIREKIFRLLGEEVPYAATVAIDRFVHEERVRRIRATVYVDRENQRAILVGKDGAQMKAIASKARADMEVLFDGPVFLEIWVRVKRGWANDDALLARFGY
jgi:GTP-binding protein Era